LSTKKSDHPPPFALVDSGLLFSSPLSSSLKNHLFGPLFVALLTVGFDLNAPVVDRY
jgi:hypothetical protein